MKLFLPPLFVASLVACSDVPTTGWQDCDETNCTGLPAGTISSFEWGCEGDDSNTLDDPEGFFWFDVFVDGWAGSVEVDITHTGNPELPPPNEHHPLELVDYGDNEDVWSAALFTVNDIHESGLTTRFRCGLLEDELTYCVDLRDDRGQLADSAAYGHEPAFYDLADGCTTTPAR